MSPPDPDFATSDSDMATSQSDLSVLDPDMAILDPDMAILDPDMAILAPDMAILAPDMTTLDPDMTILDPDMAILDPDMAVLDPDMATLDPDMTTLDPDMAILDPDMAILDPDMAVLDPDMAILDPDMAILDPDMATLDPDMATLDPDMAVPDAVTDLPNCGLLCETYEPEQLDGCDESCQPISSTFCAQDCEVTNTVHAWSNVRFLDLNEVYEAIYIADGGLVVQRPIHEGNRRFDIVSWSGSVLHSLTLDERPFQSLEATPYVYVSEEAAMIFYEWDNIYGGELFLFSWTGEELQRSDVVYMIGSCKRPALFRDRVLLNQIGPVGDCFDFPSNDLRELHTSHTLQVRETTRFEYNLEIDDFVPEYTLSGSYTYFASPLFWSIAGPSHNIRVESISDRGFIYQDENNISRLILSPTQANDPWTSTLLNELTEEVEHASELRHFYRVNQGFYAVTQQDEDENISSQLYHLNFAQGTPNAYRLERQFDTPITDLTDQHMITTRVETGLWVRDRSPACDMSGACVCRDESENERCE